jgi:hypothetical protein
MWKKADVPTAIIDNAYPDIVVYFGNASCVRRMQKRALQSRVVG